MKKKKSVVGTGREKSVVISLNDIYIYSQRKQNLKQQKFLEIINSD